MALSIASIMDELRGQSDRATAIVGGSLVEDQLKGLLQKAMVPCDQTNELFSGYAPLATFSARTTVAFVLGLIPEDVFRDLNIIRKVRNEFAHKHEQRTFADLPQRDWVENLVGIRWFLEHLVFADKPPSDEELKEIMSSPRRRFEIGVAIVSLALDKYQREIVPRTPRSPEHLWAQQAAAGDAQNART